MYQKFPDGGPVTLWCTGRHSEGEVTHKQKPSEPGPESSGETKRQENEHKVEEVYKKLLEKYANAWDIPRL